MTPYLLVSILVSAFILLFILVNQKDFRLLLYKFFFGKYSYRYVAKFKKIYFMENPYPVCIQDDFRSHCQAFTSLQPDKPMPVTATKISFGSFDFYSNFDAIKVSNTPTCYNVYKLSEKYTVKIIGFSVELMGSKIRECYFFINDSFFMGEYIFPDVSELKNDNLIKMLASKYEIPEQETNQVFYIRDAQDSLIYFNNNGFTISIQYINRKQPFVNEVLNSLLQKSIIDIETSPAQERISKIYARL
jgi:hypothetical protein